MKRMPEYEGRGMPSSSRTVTRIGCNLTLFLTRQLMRRLRLYRILLDQPSRSTSTATTPERSGVLVRLSESLRIPVARIDLRQTARRNVQYAESKRERPAHCIKAVGTTDGGLMLCGATVSKEMPSIPCNQRKRLMKRGSELLATLQ